MLDNLELLRQRTPIHPPLIRDIAQALVQHHTHDAATMLLRILQVFLALSKPICP